MKHRRGRWTNLRLPNGGFTIISFRAGEPPIGTVFRNGDATPFEEVQSNARLISEAPEMLEIIQEALPGLQWMSQVHPDIRATLRKVQGVLERLAEPIEYPPEEEPFLVPASE
jgi:hypothetical protein